MLEEVGSTDEGQLKTVLVMMLDPETRRHTVGAQRKEYRDLRLAVDEFLSAVNVNDLEGEPRKKGYWAIRGDGGPMVRRRG